MVRFICWRFLWSNPWRCFCTSLLRGFLSTENHVPQDGFLFYVNPRDLKGIWNYDSLISLKQGCSIAAERWSELEKQTSALTRPNLHLRMLLLSSEHLFSEKEALMPKSHPPPQPFNCFVFFHIFIWNDPALPDSPHPSLPLPEEKEAGF